MIIYIARHAEVPLNQKNIAFNAIDESLTEKGIKQAKKLAKRFASIRLSAIFASDTKRSYETALSVTEKVNIPLIIDKRLNDCNYGVFSNLTKQDAKEKYTLAFKKREKYKYNVPIPKGESFANIAIRWKSFFNDLKKKKLKNILIITHGTNLKVFLIEYLNYNINDADKVHFKNASVSVFSISNVKIKLLMLNDTSHLI